MTSVFEKASPMPRGLPSTTAPSSYDLYEGITYQDYWTGKDTANFNALEQAIVCELLPPHGDRLLDLGCGYGRFAGSYMDRFENVVMFDGSRSLLKAAQQATDGKACYVWGDVNYLPFRAGVFDEVLLVRVFQHLVDSRGCIQDVRRILKPGGRFLFNYSNKRNAYRVMKYLLGGTRHNPFDTRMLMVEANYYHHHPAHVEDLLNAAGFEIVSRRGAGVFNKIVEHSGFLADIIPPGISLAPFLGRFLLAPWIFLDTRVKENSPPAPPAGDEAMFVCPRCGLDLLAKPEYYECSGCRKTYPIEDGIIDMRMESL
ncbi:MAG: hypothetical protein DPW18_03005 [Chloroflexi bacterium]|nr:hypothetical protein [Chloroflexota bacterium]MDL1943056.1 methyltransferase domain-containing protein [Chloroflexi bacterium CFX2]